MQEVLVRVMHLVEEIVPPLITSHLYWDPCRLAVVEVKAKLALRSCRPVHKGQWDQSI